MKYGFSINLVDFDGEKLWVAESSDLKGCVAQGGTVDEAIAELAENEKTWLEIAAKRGINIPEPSVAVGQPEYSGKLTLRLGERLHKETAEAAKREGISVNQHIINAVVAYNTRRTAESLMVETISEATKLKDGVLWHPNIFSVPYMTAAGKKK